MKGNVLEDNKYEFCLFVAGSSPISKRAIKLVRKICSKQMDNCTLQIIDIYKSPQRALDDQIVVAPVLTIKNSGRLKRVIPDTEENIYKVLQFSNI